MDTDPYSSAAPDALPIGVPCCGVCHGPLFEYEAFCRLLKGEPDWDGPYSCSSWLCRALGLATSRWSPLQERAPWPLSAAVRARRATRGEALTRAWSATN